MKNFNLPQDYRPYIDKYFLRAKEILQKEELNPIVKAQVFIRKGDCKVYGIEEAITILTKYSNSKNMKIYTLKEGDFFKSKETLINIEAPIQDIIDLETMYLGVLSAETTLQNGGDGINLVSVRDNMRKIVELVGDRPVSYFGARHWKWDMDTPIANACRVGGAKNCSTDAGAKTWGKDKKGIGTIPHALQAIYHWKDGLENAVRNSTVAFDKHIDKSIPRIALIDYANLEVRDSLQTFYALKEKLYGIRVDTCGENIMQFGYEGKPYFYGTGVTIAGVHKLVQVLKDVGADKVKIILSSGFGNPLKIKAFVDAEELMGIKLFDSLGIGGVFKSRMATMDIIEVEGREIHKVGRTSKSNNNLKRII